MRRIRGGTLVGVWRRLVPQAERCRPLCLISLLTLMFLTPACMGQTTGEADRSAPQPAGTVMPVTAANVIGRSCRALSDEVLQVARADEPAAKARRNVIDYRGGRVEVDIRLVRQDGDFSADWRDLAQRYDFQVQTAWRYGAIARVPVTRLCALADDQRVAAIARPNPDKPSG